MQQRGEVGWGFWLVVGLSVFFFLGWVGRYFVVLGLDEIEVWSCDGLGLGGWCCAAV